MGAGRPSSGEIQVSDDGFGPVQRGGGSSRGGGAPVKPLARSESPRGRSAADDDGFGPTVGGRGGRGGRDGRGAGRAAPAPAPRRRRGTGRTLLTLLLVPLVLLLAGGLALTAYATARIDRVAVDGLGSAGATMNILVVGSDSREGLTDEEILEMGTGRVEGKRTDTIFVLSVRGTRAAMLSFPRDLYVTRCDGSQGRINSAFLAGDGESCLTQTVANLSGLPITHYLEVSFLGFRDIVDAIGGVTVELEAPIRDAAAAIDVPAGTVELDGRDALAFVRVRGIDDDLGRIGRQQYFLQRLARSAASPSTVANPVRLVRTTGAIGDALLADEGLGPIDLLRLGVAGRGMAGGSLPTFIVPATPQTIGGAAVLVPQDGPAAELFASFRDGSVFAAPPQEPEAP
jgi:LCP family protein required for cell wall assembly